MFSRGSKTEEKFRFALMKAIEALCAAYVLAGAESSIGVTLEVAEGGANCIIHTDNPALQAVLDEAEGTVRTHIVEEKAKRRGMM